MKVFLNELAVCQLEELMHRAGHKNHQHCLQVLLSMVTNSLRRKDEKAAKKAVSIQYPQTPKYFPPTQ